MKKTHFAAAALAATLVATPMPASAAAPTAPEQGGAVHIGGSAVCTIGYNDLARGVSITAAHCGNDGDRVRLYDRTDNNPRTNVSREIGTFRASAHYDNGFSNDWGEIVWDRGVTMGENRYSGDTVLTLDEVKRGEEICWHGETTHKGTTNESCGTFFERTNESFTVRAPKSDQGDSGGPIWVPGRGFLGVVSAGPDHTGPAGRAWVGPVPIDIHGKEVIWAAAPRDGKKISQRQFQNAMVRVMGLDSAGIYDGIIERANTFSSESGSSNSSSDSALSSNEPVGSSEMTAGEILAIVIPVVTVVLPALWNLYQSFAK